MQKIGFNENWLCYAAGHKEQATAVTLPHDAMLAEPRSQDSPGGKNIGWFSGGDYVYEKTFSLPAGADGQSVVFEFEGVYHNAVVEINGKRAAYRPYGYTNFYVCADGFLEQGKDNVITVTAKNADQPNSRWYSGTGIYRPVSMYLLPERHIELNGLRVKTVDYATPKIAVRVLTNGGGVVTVDIFDGETALKTVSAESDGDVELEIELPTAALWECDSPALYTCRAGFAGDTQECTFGILKIECDAKNGFRLNGKRVVMYGACIHHDNGVLGAAAHPFAEARKIRILKEQGFNAVRLVHNPGSKALLDACDRYGMLVMDEYTDMWYIHKTKHDYADHFGDFWRHDLKDMVEKDYNHPSVVLYSVGNEVAESGQERGIALCAEMTAFIKNMDDRPVTCGINLFFNYLHSLGFGVYTDKKADKAHKTKKKKHAVGSEFFNNLAGIFGDDFMKFGATLGGSDRHTRGAYAVLDVAGYNYGINRYKKDLKKYPDRVIVGSETFCADAARFYDLAQKNPALIGDFVWTGIDYLGEAGIGAWEYETYAKDAEGAGWLTAGSGRIDLTGKPLAEAAYMRVAYGLDTIRMAVVPVDSTRKKHSPSAWKFSNALESYSFNGYEGSPAHVEVYTKAYKVVLLQDGKPCAVSTKSKNARFRFKINYRPGELRAVACDRSGFVLAETALVTAGGETVLSAFPEDVSVALDGGLCYVRLAFTDSKGKVKPLVRGDIKVSVQNGTLLGLGNGCPYNERGYLSDVTETYYGEALAVIKPSGAGTVTVTATSAYGDAAAKVEAY
jgi:beta-galactosidase